MNTEEIWNKIKRGDYDLSQHAHDERQFEHITIQEIEEAILNGEVIEKYSKDIRGESVLIASNIGKRPLHIVCGRRNDRILIITVYEPKLPRWISWKIRAKELKDRV